MIVLWLLLAISARFLDAGVVILDKIILKHTAFKPLPYVFYTGILSVFTVALIIPISRFIESFGAFYVPNLSLIFLDFLAGFVILSALYFLFVALNRAETSRVMTLTGSLVPIFTFGLSLVIIGETFTKNHLLAFLFLVAGSFLIAYSYSRFRVSGAFKYTVISSFLWALYFILIKLAFSAQTFTTTIFWMQSGVIMGSLLLLLNPKLRQNIFGTGASVSGKKSHLLLFIVNKILSRVSSFMNIFAISIGSVVLVNALEGVKYAFVFLIAVLLSLVLPKVLKEELDFWSVLQKVLAIILISIGIFILI